MVLLSQRLYDIITKSQLKWKTIQFIAPNEVPNPFITYEEDDTIEIGVTKKNYLKLFKEAHHYWHKEITDISNDYQVVLDTSSSEDIWNLYLATIGYMITTNENHTIIRLHELLVYELFDVHGEEFMDKELDLITTFLISRMSRINKSSSLWFWIKKLSIIKVLNPLLQEEEDVTSTGNMIIDRALRSCQLHFANYYACNYLRWLISILRYIQHSHGNSGIKVTAQQFLHRIWIGLQERCRSNLRDVAIWNLLEYFLIHKYKPHYNAKFSRDEYNRIIEQLNHQFDNKYEKLTPIDLNRNTTDDNVTEVIVDEVKWLLKADCMMLTPYNSLVRPLLQLELYDELTVVRDILTSRCSQEQELLAILDDKSSQLFHQKSQFIHTLSSIVSK